ncbi:hypothetical protein CALVIDRAFT_552240 [Calocera viscosa TUFC12733]|uniref:Uncharacterized protein n=1 Tax=Calocera viscosa (strain TUFC12733) TaxID=1330018 RepID=A0A167RP52_CALVF|nr:hypothetical protein CALVIDRAFT_552240 [Calocera viscosa TUFC12733]
MSLSPPTHSLLTPLPPSPESPSSSPGSGTGTNRSKRSGSILENAHELPRLSIPSLPQSQTRSRERERERSSSATRAGGRARQLIQNQRENQNQNGHLPPGAPAPPTVDTASLAESALSADPSLLFSHSTTTLGTSTTLPPDPSGGDHLDVGYSALSNTHELRTPLTAAPLTAGRKSSISFAPLPSPDRPRQRRNSITLGVAARSQILRSQGAGAAPRPSSAHPNPRARGPKVVHVYEGGQDWSANRREQVVDLGELGKKLWKRWRGEGKEGSGNGNGKGREMSTEEARREEEEEARKHPQMPVRLLEEEEGEEEIEEEGEGEEGPTAAPKPTPGSPPPELDELEADAEAEAEAEVEADEEEEEEVEPAGASGPSEALEADAGVGPSRTVDWTPRRRRSGSPVAGQMHTRHEREVLGFDFADGEVASGSTGLGTGTIPEGEQV